MVALRVRLCFVTETSHVEELMRTVAIIFALMLLTTLGFAQDNSVAHALSACGPKDAHIEKPEGIRPAPAQPETGKALLFVIEDDGVANNIIGSGITLRIGVDGAWAGATSHRSPYLALALDPGEHHLCVNWQSRLNYLSRATSLAHLDAQADKLYYFRIRKLQADGQVFLDFDPIDSDQGKLMIAQFSGDISAAKKK